MFSNLLLKASILWGTMFMIVFTDSSNSVSLSVFVKISGFAWIFLLSFDSNSTTLISSKLSSWKYFLYPDDEISVWNWYSLSLNLSNFTLKPYECHCVPLMSLFFLKIGKKWFYFSGYFSTKITIFKPISSSLLSSGFLSFQINLYSRIRAHIKFGWMWHH